MNDRWLVLSFFLLKGAALESLFRRKILAARDFSLSAKSNKRRPSSLEENLYLCPSIVVCH